MTGPGGSNLSPPLPSPDVPAPAPKPEGRIRPYSDSWLALQVALGGHYEIKRELGRGGMGVVYLAREAALDRMVALKILPPTLANPQRRERFLREARIAARLRHDHIVPIHTVGEAGSFVYYTMQYIEGETLIERLITEGGPLPVGEVLRILRDVARAVHYAHERGVIHRDLKPQNILIERKGGRAYVADFGIARVLTESPLAGAGRTFGTFAYMSPEQAAGGVADRRSDVYSLGVVGWFMGTGQPVFRGTMQQVLNDHMYTPAPTLPVVGLHTDTTLARAVGKCLEKHPDRRFQTAGDLATDLSRAPELCGEPPQPLRAFLGRLKLESDVALLGMVAGVAGLGALARAVQAGQPAAGALTFLALLVGAPVLGVLPPTRKLLEGGYTLADIILALNLDLDRQRGGHESSLRPLADPTATWARRVVKVAAGSFMFGMLAAAAGLNLPEGVVVGSMVLGAFGGVPAGLVLLWQERQRKRLVGSRWLRFWRSWLGEWTVKLAGIGLGAPPAEPEPVALPVPPETQGAELNEPLQLGDVRHLTEHSLWRIGTYREARSEARARLGRLPTQEEVQLDRTLEQHQAVLEALAEKFRAADAGTGDPGSLTRDIEAALRVCEVVEGLIEGREWRV